MSKFMSMLGNKKTALVTAVKSKKVAIGTVVTAAFVSVQSHAAIDVSAATTAITTDGTSAITAIGGALIGLAATAVVFKWAKGAVFG
jgi:hypothetical protein